VIVEWAIVVITIAGVAYMAVKHPPDSDGPVGPDDDEDFLRSLEEPADRPDV
jgi:hypothetical protein